MGRYVKINELLQFENIKLVYTCQICNLYSLKTAPPQYLCYYFVFLEIIFFINFI